MKKIPTYNVFSVQSPSHIRRASEPKYEILKPLSRSPNQIPIPVAWYINRSRRTLYDHVTKCVVFQRISGSWCDAFRDTFSWSSTLSRWRGGSPFHKSGILPRPSYIILHPLPMERGSTHTHLQIKPSTIIIKSIHDNKMISGPSPKGLLSTVILPIIE